ncbi:hypothetical protein LINPERPRIM_LOCUS7418 [Linum perenne]
MRRRSRRRSKSPLLPSVLIRLRRIPPQISVVQICVFRSSSALDAFSKISPTNVPPPGSDPALTFVPSSTLLGREDPEQRTTQHPSPLACAAGGSESFRKTIIGIPNFVVQGKNQDLKRKGNETDVGTKKRRITSQAYNSHRGKLVHCEY